MKVVDLSDLQLDLANYRIPTRQEDERAALNFLWAQEDVLSLATQIIRDRYFDNEVPVVVDENGKYTVLEGNRRVAALKALHDPDGEFHDHASSTRSLLKRFATEAEDLPTAIRVLIAPDRHTVEPHIIRLHTGRAKKPWTLDQQSTYYYSLLDETTTVTDVKQMYKGVNITRMMRMASMRLFISNARFKNKKLRAYAASAELTMSALEYAYKRKDIRALFGVDFDADGRILPATKSPAALGKALTGGHLTALEVLLADFQAGKLKSRFSDPCWSPIHSTYTVIDVDANFSLETAPALEVRGLGKSFGRAQILHDIHLQLDPGTLTVLSGENGTGKSTLLECLAGAQPFDSGVLLLGDRVTSTNDRSYWRAVFGILDDFAWFPDLTVFDHFRLLAPGLSRAQANDALARLGASHLVDRLPMTLSAGQRQRCALTSATIRDWAVLLVDEPERHLDRQTMPAVATLLADLATRGAVLVASHHDALTSIPGARQHLLAQGRLAVPG